MFSETKRPSDQRYTAMIFKTGRERAFIPNHTKYEISCEKEDQRSE